MKECPKCSFLNPDRAEQCIKCRFDLTRVYGTVEGAADGRLGASAREEALRETDGVFPPTAAPAGGDWARGGQDINAEFEDRTYSEVGGYRPGGIPVGFFGPPPSDAHAVRTAAHDGQERSRKGRKKAGRRRRRPKAGADLDFVESAGGTGTDRAGKERRITSSPGTAAADEPLAPASDPVPPGFSVEAQDRARLYLAAQPLRDGAIEPGEPTVPGEAESHEEPGESRVQASGEPVPGRDERHADPGVFETRESEPRHKDTAEVGESEPRHKDTAEVGQTRAITARLRMHARGAAAAGGDEEAVQAEEAGATLTGSHPDGREPAVRPAVGGQDASRPQATAVESIPDGSAEPPVHPEPTGEEAPGDVEATAADSSSVRSDETGYAPSAVRTGPGTREAGPVPARGAGEVAAARGEPPAMDREEVAAPEAPAAEARRFQEPPAPEPAPWREAARATAVPARPPTVKSKSGGRRRGRSTEAEEPQLDLPQVLPGTGAPLEEGAGERTRDYPS